MSTAGPECDCRPPLPVFDTGTSNLCYNVLLQVAGGLIYRIDQKRVKNNRDPGNIVFGRAGREHDKFIYDDAAFLFNMAMAKRARFGYETFADLREQEIPAGQN